MNKSCFTVIGRKSASRDRMKKAAFKSSSGSVDLQARRIKRGELSFNLLVKETTLDHIEKRRVTVH